MSTIHICKISMMAFIFLVANLIWILFPKKGFYLFFLVCVCVCANESFLGFLQLFGYCSSNHRLYSITGSFQNPGPYGGMLSVIISMFIAYGIKKKKLNQSGFLYWIIAIVSLFALIILPMTQSRSALVALSVSMTLLVIGTQSINNKIKTILKDNFLWFLIVGVILATIAYLIKKPSADGRLFMDYICFKAMLGNGIRGAGIGRFGGVYGETQALFFRNQILENGNDDLDWEAINEHIRLIADCPDNAFNEYLFVGIENGPVIMLLLIGAIVYSIYISVKRKTIWCYGLTSFAVFALFSFPFHVLQFQILFPILLSACLFDKKTQKGDVSIHLYQIEKKRLAGTIINSFILIIVVIAFSLRIPDIKQYSLVESAWDKTERWHQMEYYDYVAEDCMKMFPFLRYDYNFLFIYGQSLNKIGLYEKSDSILKLGTEISSDPMFWNVMGSNSLYLGRYREAEERYKHAFYMVPNRLYPLYLLAKLYYTEGDNIRFFDMANKIESFIPKVESINTEILRSEIKELKMSITDIKENDF